jgi:glycine dehydrogenase
MSEYRLSLEDLEPAGEFARRHIGPDQAEIAAMLEVVGAASLDDLIERATPRAIRSRPRARPRRWPRCARWPSRTAC